MKGTIILPDDGLGPYNGEKVKTQEFITKEEIIMPFKNIVPADLTEENLMSQIFDEFQNTLYYDGTGRPLRSLKLKAAPYPNKISSAHFLAEFPGVGMYLISVKKVR